METTTIAARAASNGAKTSMTSGPRGRVSSRMRARGSEGMLAPTTVAVGVALLPILIPFGPGNTGPVDVVFLVAIACAALWAGATRARLRFPYGVAVTMFAITGLLAALLGPLPIDGGIAVAQDVFLFLWCLAIANVVRTPGATRLVLRVWSLTATAWAAVLVLLVLTGHPAIAGVAQPESSRASLTFGEQNGAALYFVISLMVVLASQTPVRKMARFLAAAVIVVAMILTGSLAAVAGLIAAVVATTLLSIFGRRGLAAALLALVMMVALGAGIAGFVQSRGLIEQAHRSPNEIIRNSIGRLQQSSSERGTLATEIAGLYGTGNLLGLGPTATQYSLRANQAPYPKEAHNDFVGALIERGILGEFALIALVGAIIIYASGIWRAERLAVGFRTAIPAPVFLIGALMAIAVASLAHEVLHDRTVWTMLGLVAAVSLWAGPGRGRDGSVAR